MFIRFNFTYVHHILAKSLHNQYFFFKKALDLVKTCHNYTERCLSYKQENFIYWSVTPYKYIDREASDCLYNMHICLSSVARTIIRWFNSRHLWKRSSWAVLRLFSVPFRTLGYRMQVIAFRRLIYVTEEMVVTTLSNLILGNSFKRVILFNVNMLMSQLLNV